MSAVLVFEKPIIFSFDTVHNEDDLNRLDIILQKIVIEELRKIAEDTQKRMQGFETDSSLLKKGVFYANDYYQALQQTELMTKCSSLVESGAFFHGIAPETSFTMLENPRMPTGFLPLGYRLKENIKPSQALKDLKEGLTFLGCGEAIRIARYEALRAVLGDYKFDKIFEGKSITPLTISEHDPVNARTLFEITVTKTIKKGMTVHFMNVPFYSAKHINGEEIGYNVVCSEDGDEPRFIGHGLPPGGMTAQEISELLRKAYNKKPIDKSAFPESVIQQVYTQSTDLEKFFESHTLNANDFKAHEGGQLATQYATFNLKRIQQLIEATPEEALDLVSYWKSLKK